MRLKDVVVLKYAPNYCYVQVSDFTPALRTALKINLRSGTYTFSAYEDNPCFRDIPVGEARHLGRVIGVYDRTKTEDLSKMVFAATEATRCRNAHLYED